MSHPAFFCARQGDVLLLSVEALPEDAAACDPVEPLVIKHGEATGHAHAFYDQPVELYRTPRGERFLRVVKTSKMRHEEHSPVQVPPGLYRLPEQVEWHEGFAMAVAD